MAAADRATVAGWCLTPAEAVARSVPTRRIDDPDEALRLARGGRLGIDLPPGDHAVLFGDRLLGLYRAEGDHARAQLVWTRPEELVGEAAP